MTVRSILEGAKTILTERGWRKGGGDMAINGTGPICLGQALYLAGPRTPPWENAPPEKLAVSQLVRDAIVRHTDGADQDIISYNDKFSTTREDIDAILDDALQHAPLT
jgi:hypothetical protein